MIRLKRIYDPPEETDGFRILVDRLWPRGVKKEKASIDHWARELAPSDELRKRFHRDRDFDRFREAYFRELNDPEKNESVASHPGACRRQADHLSLCKPEQGAK